MSGVMWKDAPLSITYTFLLNSDATTGWLYAKAGPTCTGTLDGPSPPDLYIYV
jgi:hypothetical protein